MTAAAARAASLAADFAAPAVCRSIAELHEKTRAQLVVIAVSELSVREVCLEAFKYSWVCRIEKHAGYDVADAEAIAAAAHRCGRHAFVALNRRHYGSTRRVVDDLADSRSNRCWRAKGLPFLLSLMGTCNV